MSQILEYLMRLIRISLATEKYVLLLNSGDELIDKFYIRYAIDYLESNSIIDFVHSSEFFSDFLKLVKSRWIL